MKFQHNKVFTRFCALLLAVVTSLLLCVPAFAAYGYGSTPTYATGNYSYNSSTSYETSTSSADWFTAVLAQLRTMYGFMFSKLNAINTAVGFCQSYLSDVKDNTAKLVVMNNTLTSIWNKLNLDISSDVSSIKNDTSSIKTLVGTSNTNTSSIYSQVLKLATEVTTAKILTAVESISTDGLATESTLSDLNSKAATESTLSSINSKVATDSHISDIYDQYKHFMSDYELNGQIYSDTPGSYFRRIFVSLSKLGSSGSRDSVYLYAPTGNWYKGSLTNDTISGFRFGLDASSKYSLNATSLGDSTIFGYLLNT